MGRYIIKIWETQQDRESGESSIVENNLDNIDQAIEKAKRIMNSNNYASLEVQNSKENKTLYFCSQKEEETYFKEEIAKEKMQEKINRYARVIYGEELKDNGDEIPGKVKDVKVTLKENLEYCKTSESNIDEEELKFINESTKELLEELGNDYIDDDYVRLIENPMAGALCINNLDNFLEDLEYEYLEKIEDMELKDINIKDVVECYFDNNELENLMEYGADTDSYTMPTISSVYEKILDILNIEYENIFTEEVSDGKYASTIQFNEEKEIVVDTKASNTYEQVASNIESVKDKYLELQKNMEIEDTEIEDIEME